MGTQHGNVGESSNIGNTANRPENKKRRKANNIPHGFGLWISLTGDSFINGLDGPVSLNKISSTTRGDKRANSDVGRRGSQGTTTVIGGSQASITTAVSQSQRSASPSFN